MCKVAFWIKAAAGLLLYHARGPSKLWKGQGSRSSVPGAPFLSWHTKNCPTCSLPVLGEVRHQHPPGVPGRCSCSGLGTVWQAHSHGGRHGISHSGVRDRAAGLRAALVNACRGWPGRCKRPAGLGLSPSKTRGKCWLVVAQGSKTRQDPRPACPAQLKQTNKQQQASKPAGHRRLQACHHLLLQHAVPR